MINATPVPANDLLRQLDDIKGLNNISAWPLAPGWWVLLASAAIILVISVTLFLRRRAWRHSWKSDAEQILSDLAAKLDDTNAQATAVALSMALRRIAMRKFSRVDFAGLEGKQWLHELEAHDPHGFDWKKEGLLLLDAPYAPPNSRISPDAVEALIRAARNWVE